MEIEGSVGSVAVKPERREAVEKVQTNNQESAEQVADRKAEQDQDELNRSLAKEQTRLENQADSVGKQINKVA